MERENNGDFVNHIFWICMHFQNNHKHLNYEQKDVWENMNLFYTDVFYPFTAKKKYKYKMHTSAKIDLKQNIV